MVIPSSRTTEVQIDPAQPARMEEAARYSSGKGAHLLEL